MGIIQCLLLPPLETHTMLLHILTSSLTSMLVDTLAMIQDTWDNFSITPDITIQRTLLGSRRRRQE